METINTIDDLRETIKVSPYPDFLNRQLIEQWADSIPVFSENDPSNPEWRETATLPLDLSSEGFGLVRIKNEADKTCNPTGTIKDRAAWELAVLYRDFARTLYLQMRNGLLREDDLRRMAVPRFTYITSGNLGKAVERCFSKYNLPPPKIIVCQSIAEKLKPQLQQLRADSYAVDLSMEYTGSDLLELSDNTEGVDITSFTAFRPELIFYDWHVHEAFNQNPDYIFVPYGSGRLMENYLAWQYVTGKNAVSGVKDPRLKIPASKVTTINIYGAEPIEEESIADKLTAQFKPFLIFKDSDLTGMRNLAFTGNKTGKYPVREDYIKYSHYLLNKYGIEAEASGAASLALYLQLYDQRQIPQNKKILIVNTGMGY